MKRATLMLAPLALLLTMGPANASVVYDTTPFWDGSSFIFPWGPVNSSTATYGQTFVAPATDNVLQNFTFYISGQGNGATVTFQADVYAWFGSLQGGNGPQGSTGPALFTSPNMTFTDNGTFQPVTVNTGGVALTPGADYVALFTTSDPASVTANADNFNSFVWGDVFAHVANNGGGGFNFYNNTSSAQLSAPPWDDFADFGDLAWRAEFTGGVSGVPEPSSLAMFGMGSATFAGYFGWRRRKKAVTA
jgi:hypothetical protein